MRFREENERYWSAGLCLGMPDPARWGKAESDPVLQRCRTVKELIEVIGEPERPEKLAPLLGGTSGGWGRRGWTFQTTTGQDW
jgi:hypothetical protein